MDLGILGVVRLLFSFFVLFFLCHPSESKVLNNSFILEEDGLQLQDESLIPYNGSEVVLDNYVENTQNLTSESSNSKPLSLAEILDIIGHPPALPTLYQENKPATVNPILQNFLPKNTTNSKFTPVPLANVIGTLVNSALEFIVERNFTKTITPIIPILNKILGPFGAALNLETFFPEPEIEESDIDMANSNSGNVTQEELANRTTTTTNNPCECRFVCYC